MKVGGLISHLPVPRWMLKQVQHDGLGRLSLPSVILNLFQDPSKLRSAAERRLP
jgi:hypothetical protein